MTRRALPSKMDAHKPDNGQMHYGMGLKGSLCGVEVHHSETPIRANVTCGECVRILRSRP